MTIQDARVELPLLRFKYTFSPLFFFVGGIGSLVTRDNPVAKFIEFFTEQREAIAGMAPCLIPKRSNTAYLNISCDKRARDAKVQRIGLLEIESYFDHRKSRITLAS